MYIYVPLEKPESQIMHQISSPSEMQQWSQQQSAQGRVISFVPTLGCLHQGHAALLQHANCCDENSLLVLSIFVNPLQFRYKQYNDYPRNLAADLAIAKKYHVAAVFMPSVADMYPTLPSIEACDALKEMQLKRHPHHFKSITPWANTDFNYLLAPELLALKMDGKLHPWFFDGVATVVSRLFNSVQPDYAFFGEKDPQQLAILKQLAALKHPDVKVIGVPTVRDDDGVASSSRNTLLNKVQRQKVTQVATLLVNIQTQLKQQTRTLDKLDELNELLIELQTALNTIEGLTIDFLEGVDPLSLEPLNADSHHALIYLAYFIDGIRLTDERYMVLKNKR